MSPIDTVFPVPESTTTRRGTHLTSCLQHLPTSGVPVTVWSLVGELDASTYVDAAGALHSALQQASGPLVADLSALTFCSAAGVGLLGEPTRTVGGYTYVLAGLSRRLNRVVDVLGSADMPPRYVSTAHAVSTIGRSAERALDG